MGNNLKKLIPFLVEAAVLMLREISKKTQGKQG